MKTASINKQQKIVNVITGVLTIAMTIAAILYFVKAGVIIAANI